MSFSMSFRTILLEMIFRSAVVAFKWFPIFTSWASAPAETFSRCRRSSFATEERRNIIISDIWLAVVSSSEASASYTEAASNSLCESSLSIALSVSFSFSFDKLSDTPPELSYRFSSESSPFLLGVSVLPEGVALGFRLCHMAYATEVYWASSVVG